MCNLLKSAELKLELKSYVFKSNAKTLANLITEDLKIKVARLKCEIENAAEDADCKRIKIKLMRAAILFMTQK